MTKKKSEIKWVVKHREEIERWYVSQGVFVEGPIGPDDDSKLSFCSLERFNNKSQ